MLGLSALSETALSELPAEAVGASVKVSGYTRNRCSTIEPDCTVILFRTSDNIPVSSTTSDGDGYYEFVDPAGEPFYAVAYSADGSLAGVTGNNLIPA